MRARAGISEAYTVIVLVSLAVALAGVVFYVSSSYTKPTPVASVNYILKSVERTDNGYKTVITIVNSGDITLQVKDVTALDPSGTQINCRADYTGNIGPKERGVVIVWSTQKPSSVTITICVEGYCFVKYVNVD